MLLKYLLNSLILNFIHSSILYCWILNADASFLDMWSLDKFQSLLNRSREDPKLKELLQQDNLVVFLHFLGCDFNGHAHRPFSSIYLNNKVVDHVAESVYNLVQDYFKDNRTSYIFTADHGMSDKGCNIFFLLSCRLFSIWSTHSTTLLIFSLHDHLRWDSVIISMICATLYFLLNTFIWNLFLNIHSSTTTFSFLQHLAYGLHFTS